MLRQPFGEVGAMSWLECSQNMKDEVVIINSSLAPDRGCLAS